VTLVVVAVMGRVQLAGFLGMVRGVKVMAMGQMCVMRRRLMLAIVVMVRGVLVMGGGLRMEFRGLAMMLDDMLGMRHDTLQADEMSTSRSVRRMGDSLWRPDVTKP